MVSIALATDRESRNALPPEDVTNIMEDCRQMGVIIAKGGLYGALRVQPPYPTTKKDIDFVLEVFDNAFNNHLLRKK